MYRHNVIKNCIWTLVNLLFIWLLMFVSRCLLVKFFPPTNSESVPFFKAFLLGARYDLRIVAIPALLLFIIGLIPAWNPFAHKTGYWISKVVYFIFSIVLLVFYLSDFGNYAYLNQRLNASIINFLDDMKASVGMIWQTYPVIKILILSVIILFVINWFIAWLFGKIRVQNSTHTVSKPKLLITIIGFILLLCLGIFGRVGQYPLRWSDAFGLGNEYASNISLNPLQSFFSSFKYRKSTYNLNELKESYPEMVKYLGVDKPSTNDFNFNRIQSQNLLPGKKPNVILVICESFSTYKSSMSGNPLNTTPFFKQLADSGLYFNNCFSPTFGTARGVWAVITGIPDVDLANTSSRNPNAVSQHTIINDFKEYSKYYFIGGSASWANIRGFLSNNIDSLKLFEESDYKAPRIDVWGVSDKKMFEEAADKLSENGDKPFFAVIQTSDNHRPYTIPDEDKNTFKLDQKPIDVLKKYGFESVDEYNAFRYTDFSYQKFMERARKYPYFNNTIFVFVGDHGIRGNADAFYTNAWTEELTSEHIPLLFYAPQLIKPASKNDFASQIDILPTLAAFCNISYINTALGRNLMETDTNHLSMSFIFDPNDAKIGIVKDSLFYWQGIRSPNNYTLMPLGKQFSIPQDKNLIEQNYQLWAKGFYQASLYLIQHNRKLNK